MHRECDTVYTPINHWFEAMAAAQQHEHQQQHQQQQQQLTGQVTYRRRLSSKLVFYDVLQSGTSQQWWEVVVKAGKYGSVQDVKDLRDTLKLGDQVQFTGWREDHGEHPAVQAVSIKVTQPWKQHSPDVAFIPQPAPKTHKQLERAVQPQQHAQQEQQQLVLPSQHEQQQQRQQGLATAGLSSTTAAAGAEQGASARHAEASSQPDISAAAAHMAGSADAASSITARKTAPQVSVCKFWVNTGRCAKGADCPYLHTLPPAAAGGLAMRRNWLQQREAERQRRSAEAGFVHNSSAAAKRQRASVFAAWLVQQYGKERLNSGAGVLDVAGGSGSLTFEMALVHGVKCTLIDPRPLKLNKLQHKQLQQAGRVTVISTLTMQQLQDGDIKPTCTVQHCEQQPEVQQQERLCQQQQPPDQQRQQQQDAQHQLEQQLQQHCQNASSIASLQQPSALTHQAAVPHEHIAAPLQLQQVQAWFGPELWDTPGWQQLFTGCSLVVGLHPDQATEPILDFAVQQQLPFAVIPCCVFPRLFSHRRLKHSKNHSAPVVTYEDLVAYLKQRGAAVQHVLDFEGANIVVYRVP